jgi:hypothetical protein
MTNPAFISMEFRLLKKKQKAAHQKEHSSDNLILHQHYSSEKRKSNTASYPTHGNSALPHDSYETPLSLGRIFAYGRSSPTSRKFPHDPEFHSYKKLERRSP